MSHKNRAARISDFRQGITFWEIVSDEVRPRMCMGRPFKSKITGINSLAVDFRSPYHYDHIDHEFLSDAGVRGQSYDGRPPRFYMSRGAALRALPIMQAYNEERRQSHSWDFADDYADDYHSDYGDYEEPDDTELFAEFRRCQKEHGTYTARTSDIKFNYSSDHKDVCFRMEGDPVDYIGVAIDSTRIRIDYAFDNETQELAPHSMFLLLHKGMWCNTEDTSAWRIAHSSSPAEFKRATATLTPLGPVWQAALNNLTVTHDEPKSADDTRFALAP